MTSRRIRLLTATAGLLWVPAIAAPAHAGVTIEPTPQGDGTTALLVAVSDGCGESATTGLTLRAPAESAVVAATAPDGWQQALDGDVVRFTGPGVAPGDVAEFILTARIGAEPGATVELTAEQQCADGSDPVSTAGFAVTTEIGDPRMAVREPADVPAGADGTDLWVGAAVFIALATGLATRWSRRSRRR